MLCNLRATRKLKTKKRHEQPQQSAIPRSKNRRGKAYARALTLNDSFFDEEPEVPADSGIFRSPFEVIYAQSKKPDTRTSNTPAESRRSSRLLNKMEEEEEISGDDEESLAFQRQPMRRGGQRRVAVRYLNSLPTPPCSPKLRDSSALDQLGRRTFGTASLHGDEAWKSNLGCGRFAGSLFS